MFSEKDDNVKKYAYIYHYDGMGNIISLTRNGLVVVDN